MPFMPGNTFPDSTFTLVHLHQVFVNRPIHHDKRFLAVAPQKQQVVAAFPLYECAKAVAETSRVDCDAL
jgi:hypothetical protein